MMGMFGPAILARRVQAQFHAHTIREIKESAQAGGGGGGDTSMRRSMGTVVWAARRLWRRCVFL